MASENEAPLSPAPKRFETLKDSEFARILEDKDSVNTKRSTQNAVNTFKAYLAEKKLDQDFHKYDVHELDAALAKFYCEARNANGELYRKSSLFCIRYGLNRHLQHVCGLDIIRGKDFKKSTQMFQAMIKELKRQGKAFISHHQPIEVGDLEKLYNYFDLRDPQKLQEKVFVDVMLHFGRRGRESIRELKVCDFMVSTNSLGLQYVCLVKEKTPVPVPTNSPEDSTEVWMEEIPDERAKCPVTSFLIYRSKLNPNCLWFFQRMKHKSTKNAWYDGNPIGHNTLGKMMSTLSANAGLSQQYSNYSLRSTGLQSLDEVHVTSRSIMLLPVHQRDSAVQTVASFHGYRDSERERILSHAIGVPIVRDEIENIPPPVNLSPQEETEAVSDELDADIFSWILIDFHSSGLTSVSENALVSLMKKRTLAVSCGNLQGILHLDRFMCPGIHSLCIEFDGQMVTPKKFTILGEKQSLKDWKKALRVNKIPLRDIMDKGYIDFADHDQTCTGKCLGRTPSKAMSPILTELKYSQPTQKTVTAILDMPVTSPGSGTGPIITEVVGGQDDTYNHLNNGGEPSSPESSVVTPSQLFMNNPNKPVVYVVGNASVPISGVSIKSEPLSPVPSPKADDSMDHVVSENYGLSELMEMADKQHSASKPITDSVEDSLKFWEGIIALGLMEDFMKEIKIALDSLKKRLVQTTGDVEREAMKLSNVVKDLGLFKVLQQRMVELQQETRQQQYKLNQEISVLQKQWTETQRRKSSLVKKQLLIDQVTTSSQIRRPVVKPDSFPESQIGKSPVVEHQRGGSLSPVVNKAGDSTIIITVNEEMEDEPCEPVPPAQSSSENEDFLVTITSGRKKNPRASDEIEDKILSERQQELEGDAEPVQDPHDPAVETPADVSSGGKGVKRKPSEQENTSPDSNKRSKTSETLSSILSEDA